MIKDSEISSFLKTMNELGKNNSIGVSNIDQFSTLINYLPKEQKILVLIHIMSSFLYKNINSDFPGKVWAISLQARYKACRFVFVTSDNSKSAVEILSGQKAENINDLMHNIFVKRSDAYDVQAISEIIETSVEQSSGHLNQQVDYAIICAMHDDEFESVLGIFKLKIDPGASLNGKDVYSGSLDFGRKIVAIYQSNQGVTDASSLATEVIQKFRPRYIFMTGVCGGDSKYKLGNVIVARYVFTFQKGKISDEGFFRELEFSKMHEPSIRRIIQSNNSTTTAVRVALTVSYGDKFSNFPFQDFKGHVEPMACSNAVIDQSNYFESVIKSVDRKVAAVEMESYGIARASESASNGETKCLIIKGIMDNTVMKNDDAKLYASTTSALYLHELLKQQILI